MASQELAKFEALLQKPAAIHRFRTLYDRSRLLTRSRNTGVTDGELMTVCAYLTGREYAGSVATKEACARLGCITSKTFDRVHSVVSNVLQKTAVSQASRIPTIYGLGQKYGFTSEELQIISTVESMLKMQIEKDLKDERTVCGVFAVVCQMFGYESGEWIKAETKLYELDPEDIALVIERVSVIHGQTIRTLVQSARNPGRSSRHSQTTHRNQPALPKAKDLGAPALKRKASEEAVQNQGPIKRAKRQANSTASTSSAHHSALSDATRQSPPATELSTLDWMSTLDGTDDPIGQRASYQSTGEFTGKESSESVQSESEDQQSENDDVVDWESLARRRQDAILRKQRKSSSSGARTISKPIFADKSFWQTTWS